MFVKDMGCIRSEVGLEGYVDGKCKWKFENYNKGLELLLDNDATNTNLIIGE